MEGFIAYDTLGFALFNKCIAKCKPCCFSCSPKSQQRIDINAESLIS